MGREVGVCATRWLAALSVRACVMSQAILSLTVCLLPSSYVVVRCSPPERNCNKIKGPIDHHNKTRQDMVQLANSDLLLSILGVGETAMLLSLLSD